MRDSSVALFKFIMMGSLAALTHGIVLVIAVSLFGLAPAWANVVAFLCAFIVSFLGHSWVTFRHHITDRHYSANLSRLAKWFTTSLLGFILNQGLFMAGLSLFGESYYLYIWFVVTAILTLSSFLIGKLWAFKS